MTTVNEAAEMIVDAYAEKNDANGVAYLDSGATALTGWDLAQVIDDTTDKRDYVSRSA